MKKNFIAYSLLLAEVRERSFSEANARKGAAGGAGEVLVMLTVASQEELGRRLTHALSAEGK